MDQPKGGVLIIYTGGTVGAVHQHRGSSDEPLVPGSTEALQSHLPLENGHIRFGDVLLPVAITSTEKLLDSTNITPSDWVSIAKLVESNYEDYCGFVILHGTDTMAFTASALSFMLENLDKPIILTGSQRPISSTRSDALQNIITSLEIAGAAFMGRVVVPEVCVFFHDVLLRGCRVTKTSADAYHGFHTPNFPPLATAGEHIKVNAPILRQPTEQSLSVRYGLNRKIAVLQLSPLMSLEMLERMLSAQSLAAVILETYGVGNAPSSREFLQIIEKTVKRGVKVVAVTQCRQGAVELGLYQVSTGLLQRGVISGLDMTAEAAQTKMAVLLEDQSLVDSVEALMQINLRGEQSQSLFDLSFPGGHAAPSALVRQDSSFPGVSYFNEKNVTNAQLRFLNIEVDSTECTELKLKIQLNERSFETFVTWDPEEDDHIVLMDLTKSVRRALDRARKTSIGVTVVEPAGLSLSWESLHLAIFAGA